MRALTQHRKVETRGFHTTLYRDAASALRLSRDAMGMIGEDSALEIRERLKGMVHPVKLVHFTQELNLEYGREAKQLLTELLPLCDKLALEVYNFLLDKDKVSEYGIDKVPATAVRNEQDYGIRFFGLPAGYEFAALLDAILSVSRGDSGLKAGNKEKLAKLSQPVHLQVFVTPT
jgi:alkyl hydroperoxide reductase subunit AhpF